MREAVIRMFMQQPFEPFTIVTSDARELDVRHPEQGTFGLRAETVIYFHPDRKIELINPAQIVSLRTIRPSDIASYSE